MDPENSQPQKKESFIKNSVTIKLLAITALMLLLLIPATMIKSIIKERENLKRQTMEEVSAVWAGAQQLNGPVLSIPLRYAIEQEGKKSLTTDYLHILPENLSIKGKVRPERLKRGIFEVVVYKSALDFSGDFFAVQEIDTVNLKEILYDQAFLTIGVSDLRGIMNDIDLRWNGELLSVHPGSKLPEIISSGITIEIPNLSDIGNQRISFDFSIDLQGSKSISFTPLGNTTNVKLISDWNSPSFNGSFLPDEREVSDKGFNASWTILQLNRNYPQYWIGDKNHEEMLHSGFGVDLILPLDDYQKSTRSVKYAVMTISLTFLIFFLVELMNKRRIHPFQYALVGLAICLFYILLISITEHTNFNFAYGVSTMGIVSMITLYSIAIFKSLRSSMLLVLTLTGIYGFLFVTLQMADYALLLGSFGLTLILGLTMYFTRNVNLYQITKVRPTLSDSTEQEY